MQLSSQEISQEMQQLLLKSYVEIILQSDLDIKEVVFRKFKNISMLFNNKIFHKNMTKHFFKGGLMDFIGKV